MKKSLVMAVIAASMIASGCSPSSTDQGATDQGTSASSGQASSASQPGNQEAGSGTSEKQPDNTGINKRDRDDQGLTSGDQGNNETDREITRKIRRAITQNEQLSTTAKNVKIITADGKTTLRGPVKSDQEKQQILAAAKSVQGVGQVDDQLEVKSQTEKSE